MLPEGFPDPKGVALPETTQDNPHCFYLFSRYYCWESWGDIPSQNRSVGTQTFPGGKHLGVIPRCSSKGRCPASFPNGRSRSGASNACPHGLFQRVEGWSTRWSQCWGSQNVNVTCICNSPRIPHVNRFNLHYKCLFTAGVKAELLFQGRGKLRLCYWTFQLKFLVYSPCNV